MIVRHNASRMAALGTFSGAGTRALFDKYESVEMRGFEGAFGGAFGEAPSMDFAEAKARAAIAGVSAVYVAGGQFISVMPLELSDAAALSALTAIAGPLGILFAPNLSPSKQALAKAYKDLGGRIQRWATVYFQWAQDGKRDDGKAYTFKEFRDYGNFLLKEIKDYTKIAATGNVYVNAVQSVSEIPDDVVRVYRNITTPTEWPLWLKATAVIGAAAGVAYIVRSFK